MSRTRLTLCVVALVTGAALLIAAGCGGGGSKKASSTGASTSGAKKGGIAHFNLQSDTDHTDPALAYYQVSWQYEYATCLKLLNYQDKAGPAGSQLVPEAAESMPTVSSDGKIYTFTVKSGFKFSPPSKEEVTAETFRFVFNRDLNPKLQSPASNFITDIAGAKERLAGKSDNVSGVTVSGNKLTIKLTTVAPDFLSRVAMPFFCALPTTTSLNTPLDRGSVPSAGPYYITDRTPNRRIVLTRNPNYSGDRPQNLDRIEYSVGISPDATVLQIKRGSVDYAADGVPPTAHSELGPKYGPNSQVAKDGKQQYFVNPTLSFRYLAMNTTRPLFKAVQLRQAVNYAIDRPALLRQRGAYAGDPTDQYLPPGIPGFKDADLYPLNGPDLAKAKQMAGSTGGTAVLYTCNESPCPENGQIIQANLKKIGINVDVRQFPRAVQFQKEGTRGEPFDIADEGWIADYADPYDFINVLLSGKSIQAENNVNFSYFNDPTYSQKMEATAQLAGAKRFSTYGSLDADLAQNAAPLAAWDNDNERDFFSSRIGCQLYQPVYTMDIGAFCIR